MLKDIKTPNLPNEKWLPIAGYEKFYSISNMGRVRREAKITSRKGHPVYLPQIILRQRIQDNGYPSIGLTKNKKRRTFLVHRLVSIAFVENTNNHPAVNHKNGIKADNRHSNLEWCTFSQNSRHAKTMGLTKDVFGEDHGMTTLKNEDVLAIREKYANGMSGVDISKRYPSVTYATVMNIINRKTWGHI